MFTGGSALPARRYPQGPPEYGEVGVGRDDGKTVGEYSAILYLSDRYCADEEGTFWFSETPEIPGSKDWGNSIPCWQAHCISPVEPFKSYKRLDIN